MHSSHLRGSAFAITVDGRATPHAELYDGVAATTRVGVVSPRPLDGLGAALWILGAVTAFYDRYRETGDDFFAYPDFFTFQFTDTPARYSALDIWPERKNVSCDAATLPDALTDRAVDTLLLPVNWRRQQALEPLQRAALERALVDAWEYAPEGCLDGSVHLRCPREPVGDWVEKVRATAEPATPGSWADDDGGTHWRQSLQRLGPAAAIDRLGMSAP
jgi:hypothetical protein